MLSSGWSSPATRTTARPGMYPFPAANEILREPLAMEDGYLLLPDSPGLGIEVDESIVEKYPFIPGPWSYFKIDSPPETVAVTGDHSVKWVEGEQPKLKNGSFAYIIDWNGRGDRRGLVAEVACFCGADRRGFGGGFTWRHRMTIESIGD